MADDKILTPARGMGFVLDMSFPSLAEAYEALDTIPFNHYIVINNRKLLDQHGKVYKKTYNNSGQITLEYTVDLNPPMLNNIAAAADIRLLDMTVDDDNVYNYSTIEDSPVVGNEAVNNATALGYGDTSSFLTLKTFIDDLYSFLENI